MRLVGWILTWFAGIVMGLAAPPDIALPETFHVFATVFVIAGVCLIARAK